METKYSKAQILYAISKVMDYFERDEVSFTCLYNKPEFRKNNHKYEVFYIYTPEMDDSLNMSVEMGVHSIDPYIFRADHFTYQESDFRGTSTLLKLYYAVVDYICEGYFEGTIFKGASDMLKYFCDEYTWEKEDLCQ